jgi:hypothetical protein
LFGYVQRIASGLGIRAREVIAARKMKPASSLGGVLLVSKRQRADGLQDVKHRLVAWRAIADLGKKARWTKDQPLAAFLKVFPPDRGKRHQSAQIDVAGAVAHVGAIGHVAHRDFRPDHGLYPGIFCSDEKHDRAVKVRVS